MKRLRLFGESSAIRVQTFVRGVIARRWVGATAGSHFGRLTDLAAARQESPHPVPAEALPVPKRLLDV
jgi:hypothetical protein